MTPRGSDDTRLLEKGFEGAPEANLALAGAPLGESDTSTTIGPLTEAEWSRFRERFLFLAPPADSFHSPQLGQLLLDSSHLGQLYVKGIYITNGSADHGLGSGLNLTHMRLDRDRRAVVHASDLESQAAALWVRAIDARPELAQRLYRLLASEAPGADVRRVAEFLNAKERPTAVDAIAQEFLLSMGPEAVPVAQGACPLCMGCY